MLKLNDIFSANSRDLPSSLPCVSIQPTPPQQRSEPDHFVWSVVSHHLITSSLPVHNFFSLFFSLSLSNQAKPSQRKPQPTKININFRFNFLLLPLFPPFSFRHDHKTTNKNKRSLTLAFACFLTLRAEGLESIQWFIGSPFIGRSGLFVSVFCAPSLRLCSVLCCSSISVDSFSLRLSIFNPIRRFFRLFSDFNLHTINNVKCTHDKWHQMIYVL